MTSERVVLFVVALAWGCEPEPMPWPWEDGFVHCQSFDAGVDLIECEVVDVCCERVTAGTFLCGYITQDGTEHPRAAENDCFEAADDLVCDVSGASRAGTCG